MVGFCEVAALDNLNSQKIKHIPRTRIHFPHTIVAVNLTSPRHSSPRYQPAVAPGHVFHLRVLLQRRRNGFRLVAHFVRHVRHHNVLAVEAHIVFQQESVLNIDQNSHNNECDGNRKLHHYKRIAQRLSGLACAEIRLERKSWLKRCDVERRIKARTHGHQNGANSANQSHACVSGYRHAASQQSGVGCRLHYQQQYNRQSNGHRRHCHGLGNHTHCQCEPVAAQYLTSVDAAHFYRHQRKKHIHIVDDGHKQDEQRDGNPAVGHTFVAAADIISPDFREIKVGNRYEFDIHLCHSLFKLLVVFGSAEPFGEKAALGPGAAQASVSSAVKVVGRESGGRFHNVGETALAPVVDAHIADVAQNLELFKVGVFGRVFEDGHHLAHTLATVGVLLDDVAHLQVEFLCQRFRDG